MVERTLPISKEFMTVVAAPISIFIGFGIMHCSVWLAGDDLTKVMQALIMATSSTALYALSLIYIGYKRQNELE